jgi:hypothetical protein
MYCSVVAGLRWPAKRAISCNSQWDRARSVRHKCRGVCVLKRDSPARTARARMTLDYVQSVMGCVRVTSRLGEEE